MAKVRNSNRIATVKRGRKANPIISDWVIANKETITEGNGCDFDRDDIGMLASLDMADPISAVCREVSRQIGATLSGDSSRPEEDPNGYTMPDGRVFYGLSPVNSHSK